MDQSIRQLCSQLLQPTVAQADREELENRLLAALEQWTNADAILHFLRTETNQMALFVAVELLAKANLKQGVCGVNRQFLSSPLQTDEAVTSSSAFLAKKRLIDGALEVLVARRGEFEERLVDSRDQIDSLCNLVGAGLKMNWVELSSVENYGEAIASRFFGSQDLLLVLIGRPG